MGARRRGRGLGQNYGRAGQSSVWDARQSGRQRFRQSFDHYPGQSSHRSFRQSGCQRGKPRSWRRRSPALQMAGGFGVTLVVLAVLALLWQLGSSSGLFGSKSAEDLLSGNTDQVAQDLLALTVDGAASRESLPDYSRDEFGTAWSDVDHNSCDTRNDVLARDLENIELDADGCKVLTGTLADPYSGEQIDFQRGTDTSSLVQIDHVVALADAWESGAWEWDAATRLAFANDPANLLAVSGSLNQEKGAGAADEWLPPNQDFQCEYVSAQVEVKTKYALSVTQSERDAMAQVIAGCS